MELDIAGSLSTFLRADCDNTGPLGPLLSGVAAGSWTLETCGALASVGRSGTGCRLQSGLRLLADQLAASQRIGQSQ